MPGAQTQQVSKKDLLRSLLERALAEQAKGALADAAAYYREALKIDPQNSGVLFNLGVVFFKSGNHAEAAEALAKAKKLGQKTPDLNKLLGASLLANGQPEAAEEPLQAFMKAAPADAVAFALFVEALAKGKKHLRVLDALKGWQARNPGPYFNSNFYALEADAQIGIGEPEKARTLLEDAIAAHPDDISLWPVMGHVYNTLRLFDRELEMHKRAWEKQPNDPKMISNYGLALANQNRLDDAIALFDQALAQDPLLSPILVNRAYAHKKNQNLQAAIADLEMALKINPVSPHAHYALGCNYIQTQDYQKGWPHYEWFWHVSDMPKFRPTAHLPDWHDEDLSGKHILLYVDQGIGDTILFMRYVPLMFERYKNLRMSIICEEKLHPLLARSLPEGIAYMPKEKLKMGQSLDADCMAAFGSLHSIFDTAITDVPAPIPYLKTDRKLEYKKDAGDLVIGISWYTKSLDAGYKRSIDLQSFAFLKDIPGVRVVDLQYGDTAGERAKAAEAGFSIIHDDTVDPWNDMQSQVDQIAACDLVISVDNTTVHAAGALGVPVWTLLPYDGYWRWHTNDCISTPWYPTMRLFRQDESRDFSPVMKRVEDEVKKFRGGDRSVLEPAPFVPRSLPAKPQKTAVLLNDTSTWYHWGCTATSQALQRNITAAGYAVVPIAHQEVAQTAYDVPSLAQFDDPLFLSGYRYRNPTLFDALARCDRLVINGEGTIHGTAPNAIRLLYLAYVTKTVFKKPVHIVNHACFPEDGATLSNPQIIAYYLKAYRAADHVVVRDAISHQLLTSLGINNTLGFDSLPLTAREWIAGRGLPAREKHVILAGSSLFSGRAANAYQKNINDLLNDGHRVSVLIGAAIHKAGEDRPFCEWVQKLFGDRVDIIDAKSLDEWFALLGSAALLVSGRFHYSIAAACFGTPFVAFEGNTPKLHALCELLEEKPPLVYTDPDLSMQMTLRIAKALREGPLDEEKRKSRLEKLCALAMKNYENL